MILRVTCQAIILAATKLQNWPPCKEKELSLLSFLKFIKEIRSSKTIMDVEVTVLVASYVADV